MPWQDRIRPAAFVSPSGVRIEFFYEDVSKSWSKLTSAYDFPDANGTYVQDLGRSGRRYPIRIFIWGDNYDLEAAVFENALSEQGIGRLEHPIYGTVNVVPFGEIVQRDDLKSAGNQAVFEITFWETISILFPTGNADPGRSVISSILKYNEVSSESFKKKFNLISALQSVGLKNRFRKILQFVRKFTQAVAAPRNEILLEFNSIYDSINKSLDLLVNSFPTSGGFSPSKLSEAVENLGVLSGQTALLIQTPARAVLRDDSVVLDASGQPIPLGEFDFLSDSVGVTNGETQLQAYEDLASEIIFKSPEAIQAEGGISAALEAGLTEEDFNVQEPDVYNEGVNNFNVDDFFALTTVTGAVLSVIYAQFLTKSQAVQAAERLISLFESVVAWREFNYEAFENSDFLNPQQAFKTLGDIIDTGEAYQQIQKMVALAAGFLVEISFSLKQERKITLDRNRTVIDLVVELYGRVDSELDFFIASNNLTGDEILELPKGRQVVYYV